MAFEVLLTNSYWLQLIWPGLRSNTEETKERYLLAYHVINWMSQNWILEAQWKHLGAVIRDVTYWLKWRRKKNPLREEEDFIPDIPRYHIVWYHATPPIRHLLPSVYTGSYRELFSTGNIHPDGMSALRHGIRIIPRQLPVVTSLRGGNPPVLFNKINSTTVEMRG